MSDPTIDAIVVALLCADDYDLDQVAILGNSVATLEKVRAGALHDGDCTKQAHTCFVCLIEQYERKARAFLAALPDELNPSRLTEPNTREVERRRLLHAALQKHHDWHLQSGSVGLPDGEGGWIEIDNAAEYSDSALCSETMKALSDAG